MKYLLICLVLLFTSCGNIQEKVRNTFQTENAKEIRNNYQKIIKLLSLYKSKLDKRNPKNYSIVLDRMLKENIFNNENTINLFSHKKNTTDNYTNYFEYAFDKEKIRKNRNDYLIIGLYKMFYFTYKMDVKHKMIALSYDLEHLQNTYKNLQVIQWKIKFDKSIDDKYLFLTWQKNWQIELEKKLKNNQLEDILLGELSNIKSEEESLLDPSNNSFEIITAKMLLHVADSIKRLHAEPENLSTEAILSFIFLI